jgi:hypothetical protein
MSLARDREPPTAENWLGRIDFFDSFSLRSYSAFLDVSETKIEIHKASKADVVSGRG